MVTIQKHGFIKKGFSGHDENFLAGGGSTSKLLIRIGHVTHNKKNSITYMIRTLRRVGTTIN